MKPPSDNFAAGISRLDQPSTGRSILSVLLFVHLFCVGVVLASNYRRSPLLERLVSFFAVYTRALNFDPNFTPFQLTTGMTSDDDHLIEVEIVDGPAAGEKYRLPLDRSPWLDERRRFIALTNLMGSQAENLTDEDDANDVTAGNVTAELAKALGLHYLKEHGGSQCVVRAIHRLSQPRDLDGFPAAYPRDNAAAPQYDRVIYTSDVLVGADGEPIATRRQATRDVAPVKNDNTKSDK